MEVNSEETMSDLDKLIEWVAAGTATQDDCVDFFGERKLTAYIARQVCNITPNRGYGPPRNERTKAVPATGRISQYTIKNT